MLMNRRSFLSYGVAGAAALLLRGTPLAAADLPQATPRLRLSSWLKHVKGDLPEQLAWVEKMGFESIELRGQWETMAPVWKAALKNSKLVPSAMDWSSMGHIVAGSAADREKSLDSLKRAIDVAGDLNTPNVIIVPPRLNKGLDLPSAEKSVAIMRDTFASLAPRAAAAGTCLAIEPVNRVLVNCINTMGEAAALCREIGQPGVGIVFDFQQIMREEPDLDRAMQNGGAFVRQIHLSSRRGHLPGYAAEDREKYLQGFRGLKRIGYGGICSFECGSPNSYMEKVGESMTFLRNIWGEV